MDEKLNELLHTVRRTAAGAACGVCRKTEELVSAVRLRQRVAELEREEEARLAEAGRMVYATHTGTPTESEDLLSKLQEIDELHAQLADINDALGRVPEPPVCSTCGAAIREGDAFCRECGGKL